MEKCKMEISAGVAALLANAHKTSASEKYYYFEGDLCQMAKAASLAEQLGIKTGINGGLPFVSTKEDYDKVVNYIVINKVEGYWHYE